MGDCLCVCDYCWLICDIRNVHWQWNGIVGVDNVTYMLSSVVCECIWFQFDVIVVWYFFDGECMSCWHDGGRYAVGYWGINECMYE